MWFSGVSEEIDNRERLINLIKSYDCQADLLEMTNADLQDHLYDHQFDYDDGEWPEDP